MDDWIILFCLEHVLHSLYINCLIILKNNKSGCACSSLAFLLFLFPFFSLWLVMGWASLNGPDFGSGACIVLLCTISIVLILDIAGICATINGLHHMETVVSRTGICTSTQAVDEAGSSALGQ